MARYTTAKEFTFNNLRDTRALVVETSVTLEVWSGDTYVADANSPLTTGAYEIFTKGLKIRITPSLNGYLIEEGDMK
jgi:hypothetical protein